MLKFNQRGNIQFTRPREHKGDHNHLLRSSLTKHSFVNPKEWVVTCQSALEEILLFSSECSVIFLNHDVDFTHRDREIADFRAQSMPTIHSKRSVKSESQHPYFSLVVDCSEECQRIYESPSDVRSSEASGEEASTNDDG
jgi:hypothetical protein